MKPPASHRRPTGRQRVKGLVALLAGLSLALVPTLASISPASAAGTPTIQVSKSTVNPAGETITVSATGFPTSSKVDLGTWLVYDWDGRSAPKMDYDHAIQALVTDADGNLAPTEIKVKPKLRVNHREPWQFIDCLSATDAPRGCEIKITGTGGTKASAPVTFKAPPPAITVSKTSNLDPAGEDVTVSGTGYTPGLVLNVATMAPYTPGGPPPLDYPRNVKATVGSDGTFGPVTVSVRALINPFHGSKKDDTLDCREAASPCTIVAMGGGGEDQANSPTLTFAGAVETGPKLTASKTEGVDVNGEKLTVNGSGFEPKIGLFLTLCDLDEGAGAVCDYVGFVNVQTDADGNFTTEYDVKGTSMEGVDCLTANCGLAASKVGDGGDTANQAFLELGFVDGPGNGDDNNADNGDGDNAGDDDVVDDVVDDVADDDADDDAADTAAGGGASSAPKSLPKTGAPDALPALVLVLTGMGLMVAARRRGLFQS